MALKSRVNVVGVVSSAGQEIALGRGVGDSSDEPWTVSTTLPKDGAVRDDMTVLMGVPWVRSKRATAWGENMTAVLLALLLEGLDSRL